MPWALQVEVMVTRHLARTLSRGRDLACHHCEGSRLQGSREADSEVKARGCPRESADLGTTLAEEGRNVCRGTKEGCRASPFAKLGMSCGRKGRPDSHRSASLLLRQL